MNEQRIPESPSWIDPRGQVMKTPDDVAKMLRLKAYGRLKRIARLLGCSHHTVKGYVAADGVKPFKSQGRPKRLDGLEGLLRERFIRHRGNADVVRQDLLADKGVAVSRRTLQRAVQPCRQALRAEALATTRFEAPRGPLHVRAFRAEKQELVRRDRERVHDSLRRAGGSSDGQSARARRAPRRGEPVG